MKKTLLLLALAALPLNLWAAEGETTISRSEVEMGGVHSRPLNFNAQVGVFDYTSRAGLEDSSVIGGALLEWNASEVLNTASRIYYGATTGLSFTRASDLIQDSNVFIVPLNALIGYHLTDQLLVGAHGGWNLYYQSEPTVLNLGNFEDNLQAFSNVGFNASWSFSPSFALSAKAGWTFSDLSNPFVATLGLAIPLS